MDRVVEAFGSGIGNSIGWLADHYVLFGLFVILWAAFGVALVVSQGSIDHAWQAIRAMPVLLQVVVWVLFLPVVAGLWIWETTWPLIVRLVLVIGVAGWNLLVFLPRAVQQP
ncbi:MAG TPA: hypothetical protein VKR30_12870 [Candidatus Limnocylindrales bacterium]|nr:hypothetical protein [Candidatus Limnocylindrales bacterium]